MYRNKNDFNKLSTLLGYTFKNQKLLLRALTRTSALNEGLQSRDIQDFQQLEFVGDSILNTVISGILVKTHPHWKEGQLTQEKTKWVNNNGPLAHVARNLMLGEFLIMGKGEERLNLRNDTKVLSDAMEALIGAIWIDSDENYSCIKQFIIQHWTTIGLIAPAYKTLTEIIRDEALSPTERIRQFDTAFANQLLTQEQLEEIFTVAINECEELEIITMILNTHKIKTIHLNEALITSIEQGIYEQVKLLLHNGADANAVIEHYPGYDRSLSMLQLAIVQISDTSEYKDTLEIVETLLQHKADPDWQGSITTISRETIRQEAREQMQTLHSICFPEMDYEDFGVGGYTLSDVLTFSKKNGKTVIGLKAQPQKPPIQHKNLKTALHIVAELDSIYVASIISLLLQYGAIPNLKDAENKTPTEILKENYANTEYVRLVSDLEELLNLFPKERFQSNLSNDSRMLLHLMANRSKNNNNNNTTNTSTNITNYYGHFLKSKTHEEEKPSSFSSIPSKTYSSSDEDA